MVKSGDPELRKNLFPGATYLPAEEELRFLACWGAGQGDKRGNIGRKNIQ